MRKCVMLYNRAGVCRSTGVKVEVLVVLLPNHSVQVQQHMLAKMGTYPAYFVLHHAALQETAPQTP